MKRTFLTLIVALMIATPQSALAQKDSEAVAIETLTAGEGEKKIITSGYGYNAESAVQDALRNAVSEAVGAMVSSTTIVENDELIKDEVLSLSHGFVKTYRKLSESGNSTDGYEVMVVAIITEKQLIQTLETKGVKVEYNAGGIFAQYNAWDNLKKDELAMVEKFFGVEALEARSSNVYDYQIQLHEPVRRDEKYEVGYTITATQNSNYEAEFDYFKSLLAELCYEVVPLTFQMPTVNLDDALPEANHYVYKTPNGFDRKGRQKFKTHGVDICTHVVRRNRTVVEPSRAYGTGASDEFYTKFLSADEDYITTQLLYAKYNKLFSAQDISRLNDSQLPRSESVVFDIFNKSFTPYIFALVEDSNVLTSYKYITLYKFTNPESLLIIKRYLSWMFGEMKCDVIFKTTNGDHPTHFGSRNKCVFEVVDEYETDTWGDTSRCIYEGYAFLKPTRVPHTFHQGFMMTFTAEQFSTIRNIEIVPHLRTDLLKEISSR